jgi:hypothetical protein
MKSNPFEFIDTVIDPIPFVGRVWADALYTVLGLTDAFNLRHLRNGVGPLPNVERNVIDLPTERRVGLKLAKAA